MNSSFEIDELNPDEAVELYKGERFGEINLDWFETNDLEEMIKDNLEDLVSEDRIEHFSVDRAKKEWIVDENRYKRQIRKTGERKRVKSVGPSEMNYLTREGYFGSEIRELMHRQVADLEPEEASIIHANIYGSLTRDNFGPVTTEGELKEDPIYRINEEMSGRENKVKMSDFEGRLQSDELGRLVQENTQDNFEIEDFVVGRESTTISAEGENGRLMIDNNSEGITEVCYEPYDIDVDSDFTVSGIELFKSDEGALKQSYENPQYLEAGLSALSKIDKQEELFHDKIAVYPQSRKNNSYTVSRWD